MSNVTVTRQFKGRSRRGSKQTKNDARLERIPRVAKLMALAICFDELIRTGTIVDQAELARVGRVTRARVTQIMNLLNLAPDLQERLLHVHQALGAANTPSERSLRTICAKSSWLAQRRKWSQGFGTIR